MHNADCFFNAMTIAEEGSTERRDLMYAWTPHITTIVSTPEQDAWFAIFRDGSAILMDKEQETAFVIDPHSEGPTQVPEGLFEFIRDQYPQLIPELNRKAACLLQASEEE